MNFGREIQDFIQAFDAGWGMANKREEREWEREQRQMKREDHQRVRDRDAIGDDQWERGHSLSERRYGLSERQFSEGVRQYDQNHEYNVERDGITDTQTNRRLSLEEQRIQNDRIKSTTGGIPDPDDTRTYDSVDRWVEGGVGEDAANPLMRNTSYSARRGGGGGGIEDYIRTGLIERGLPEHVANGFLLNFKDESGLNPGINERAPLVPGSRGGYGLYQLTGPRRVEYERFAQNRGVDPSDVDAQLDWLMHELQGPERGAAQSIMASRNTGEAAAAIVNDFLRPSPEHRNRRANSYRTLHMARGGVVPDEEDELVTAQPRLSPPQTNQTQTALPEEGSVPEPRYAQADTGQSTSGQTQHIVDPYERGVQAALDGLRRAQEITNANMQEALDTPEVKRAQEMYLRGYGAAPQQVIRQITDRIDPERSMPSSERNIRAIGSAWQYFMDEGDYDSAQQVAATMIQAMRQEEQKLAAVASAAAEAGDIDTASRAAVEAYANVPNGRDLTIEPTEDGNYAVSIVDQSSRTVVAEQAMSPREIAAMAMGVDIGNFDTWILDAAGADRPEFEPPSLSDNRAGEGAIAEAVEMQLADAGFKPDELGAIQDVATGLNGVEQNGLAPDAAVRFATSLFAFDKDNPDNQEPNFEISDIPRNTTHKYVTANGQTYRIPNNQAALLERARGEMAAGRQAEHEANLARGAAWDATVEKGIQAAKDFGAAAWGPNGPISIPGLEPTLVEESDQPAANPYGTPIPSDDTANDEVQRLLQLREQLLANQGLRERNPEQYDTLLQRTEDQLRALGYTENRGR